MIEHYTGLVSLAWVGPVARDLHLNQPVLGSMNECKIWPSPGTAQRRHASHRHGQGLVLLECPSLRASTGFDLAKGTFTSDRPKARHLVLFTSPISARIRWPGTYTGYLKDPPIRRCMLVHRLPEVPKHTDALEIFFALEYTLEKTINRFQTASFLF